MIGLLVVSLVAYASVYEERVSLEEGWLDPDDYDALLEEAVGRAPAGTEMVRLVAEDESGALVPADSLLPLLDETPTKAGEPLYRSVPEASVSRGTGFLEDRAVYLSQCHGWIWNEYLGRFATQRGNNWDTVEDFHNPEGMNQYLMNYLENAGAQIFPVKERDLNPLWAFSDNDGLGYSESGGGFSSSCWSGGCWVSLSIPPRI